jgi:cysteine-rich repeat protein
VEEVKMQKKFLSLSMLGLLSAGMLAGCPGGNNNDVEICNNNADDDGDGDRDCADSDCAADALCSEDGSCEKPFLTSDESSVEGNLNSAENISDATCQLAFNGADGPDHVYFIEASFTGDLQFVLNGAADLGVFVQTECGDIDSEVGCADAFLAGAPETLVIPVQEGESFFVFVGGFTEVDAGTYTLDIAPLPPEDICNDLVDDNGNGFFDCSDDTCQGTPDCIPGAGLVGDACLVNTECAASNGDPICLDEANFNLLGGRCSEFCDAEAADAADGCPGDGRCIGISQVNAALGVCFDTCNVDADCLRPGDACQDFFGDGQLVCFTKEICDNGVDDNDDDAVDCDDAQCAADLFCVGACGDGLVAALEGCDDGNTTAGDGCDAACAIEDGFVCSGEPSVCATIADICAAAVVLPLGDTTGDNTGGSNIASGSCQISVPGSDGLGSEDIFSVTAANTGEIAFTLTSDADLGVYAQSTCGDAASEIGCADNFFGAGAVETLRVAVTAGQTFTLFVDGFTIDEVGPYTLSAAFNDIICGDGILSAGEGCDDGNTTAGDGCDAVCAIEDGFICEGSPSVCVSPQAVCNAAVVAALGTNTGDTTDAVSSNLFDGSCQAGAIFGPAPEDLFVFTPAVSGDITLTLTADADLGVYARSSCLDETTELGCADLEFGGDIETLVIPGVAGTPITIFVDGFAAGEEGPYTLDIAQ